MVADSFETKRLIRLAQAAERKDKPVTQNLYANTFSDVMIDIETLSTHKTNAVLLTIGAVEFSLTTQGPVIGRSFLVAPALREQLFWNRVVDDDTVQWWNDPLKLKAKENWLAECEQPTVEALAALNAFIHGRPVWAHGPNFDLANIEGLAKQAGVTTPWPYNGMRDERTVMKFNPRYRTADEFGAPDPESTLIAHDAVDDCIRQVWTLWEHTPVKNLEAA